MNETEYAERIAVLELKVETMTKSLESLAGKMDELLELKSQGMGAFWLASTILGTGIISAVVYAFNYFRG